ncbi:hypothetical protein [Robbsia andropogonis]|uniref:hypothetical protein n=1 Tax=Robbsia andropogonis TaxID=28092 RepID=UPI002A6AEA18|nr:hypothetical protein [Robbsia andropogonis]
MNHSDIKAAAELLDSLGCEGIIAGGAIRDAVLHRLVKDFDVYVENTPANMEALQRRFPNMTLLDTESDDYEGAAPMLLVVYEANERHDGKPIQIMLVRRDPVEYVQSVFDFGLCKAYLCNTLGLVLEPEFIQDVRAKTITYYPSDDNHYSETRAQRLSEKYADYRVVVPDGFRA